MKKKGVIVSMILVLFSCHIYGQQTPVSLSELLAGMRDVSALPELARAKTSMASTWDRNGGNNDDADFKALDGRFNVLLDVDGPGCVFRIFTGILSAPINESIDINRTHLQVFIDHQQEPLIDCPVKDFFTDNPFTAYPFVFGTDRTYPGFLLPVPFSKHIKIQLWSKDAYPAFQNWGNYWQVTYTQYAPSTPVRSFSLPLTPEEKIQMKKTGDHWINSEKNHFGAPDTWERSTTLTVAGRKEAAYSLDGAGVIRALKISVLPNTPDALKEIRFRIYWNGMPFPSVDVPLGYFFGNADYGSKDPYSSLLMGVDSTGGYCLFPMPFTKGAQITFTVPDSSAAKEIRLELNIDKKKVSKDWGYFHTTWNEENATARARKPGALPGEILIPAMPKYGKRNVPVHMVLNKKGFRGKYVGVLLHVAWPSKNWWGEGDWLIWSDENGWPPAYHGTGTEEYFNSGWGDFDNKAISGAIHKKVPGNVLVYSFHVKDAFNFDDNIKIGVERWNVFSADDEQKCIWGSTAYWYAEYPVPAESDQRLLSPRLWDDQMPFKEIWK